MRTFYPLLCLCLFLLATSSAFAQKTMPVRFAWGTEFFPDNFENLRQHPDFQPGELTDGYYLRYIQCAAIPNAASRQALESQGIRFLEYVHFGAYLLAIPPNFDLARLDAIEVRSMLPVTPDWKIARSLTEKPWGDWAVHGNEVEVNLMLYPFGNLRSGAERCRQLGFSVLEEGKSSPMLRLRVPADAVETLAALPFVRALELVPPPGQAEDLSSGALHRSNLIDSEHPLGKKYNGEGVRVMVRDDGPVADHPDFKGRLENIAFNEIGTHGDQVSGAMSGAGNINPNAKGMAAGADVFVVNYVSNFQDTTLSVILDKGITITNSSYSDGCNAGYTFNAYAVDVQLYENPALMHVFSAGNSNGADCGYGAGSQWGNITGGHKAAKNAIACANTNALGAINSSSSRGPAHDGRLKPDISGHGTNVLMTTVNNSYQSSTGTSFSAPAIAGCLAQLTHAFKSLNSQQQPDATLLKAAMLNTANDLGQPGPDFIFGWGHVNTWRALQTFEKNHWTSGQTDQGVQSTHTIQVPAGARQLRVMICWAEQPSALNTDRALINDLDLQLAGPGGAVYHPWLLDPTPNPSLLNAPATRGRDSLNNVEQVLIDNPAEGEYLVQVSGFEVPMGPQPYYLVWEISTDDLTVTHPAGGEALVPGATEPIHWDATGTFNEFTLRYSADDGQTWNLITTVPGNQRLYNWQVPELASGKMRISVEGDNTSAMSALPFSIAPVPAGLQISKVCPDSMTVAWTPLAADTLQYEVYLLGAKYMEIVGATTGSSLTFPIQSAGTDKWASVRASTPNGLAGQRAYAVNAPGGLLNCTQNDDLALLNIKSDGSIASCGPTDTDIKIIISNEGLNPVDGALLNYQIDDGPVVSEPLPTLAPDVTTEFQFQTPYQVSTNGVINIRVWSDYAEEDARYNDTLRSTTNVVTQPYQGYFTEIFQAYNYPPVGWRIINPDGYITWQRISLFNGPGGEPGNAMYVNCFSYANIGAEDQAYMIPMDLTNAVNPGLRFRMAHARYDAFSNEQLRVEVLPGCDENAAPVVVWSKTGAALATVNATTTNYVPDDADNWRTEGVDLSAFTGQNVLVRFVSVNDYGNNIYVGQIGLTDYDLADPLAEIIVPNDSICRGDSIQFAAVVTDHFSDYSWSFGTSAIPANAAGPGPHWVRYNIPGDRLVRLITQNTLGRDTGKFIIKVLPQPTANFSFTVNGATVIFDNNSNAGLSYLWDFGDGATSTEENPAHTYTASGTYPVRLETTNQCGTTTKLQNVSLTVPAREPQEITQLHMLPNPTTGDFRVLFHSLRPVDVQCSLLDAQGRLIHRIQRSVVTGDNTLAFEGLSLPQGVYQLQLKTESGVQTFKLAIQR